MVYCGETQLFKTSLSPRSNTTLHLNVLFRSGETLLSACGFQMQPATRTSKTIGKTKKPKGTQDDKTNDDQKPPRTPTQQKHNITRPMVTKNHRENQTTKTQLSGPMALDSESLVLKSFFGFLDGFW